MAPAPSADSGGISCPSGIDGFPRIPGPSQGLAGAPGPPAGPRFWPAPATDVAGSEGPPSELASVTAFAGPGVFQEGGRAGGIRTPSLLIWNQPLYRWSYCPSRQEGSGAGPGEQQGDPGKSNPLPKYQSSAESARLREAPERDSFYDSATTYESANIENTWQVRRRKASEDPDSRFSRCGAEAAQAAEEAARRGPSDSC